MTRGGGAPSDNTTVLRRLIERKVHNAALAPIWDPIAVRLCFDAGLRGALALRIGGLKRDAWQSFGPTQVPLGDCAAIRLGGIEVVAISNRT